MGTLSFPVFRDINGERFVFPGFYASDERPYNWGYARHICVALHLEEENDRLVVTPDSDGSLTFPHVEASAGHRGFAHGSSDVWLIGGPTFDAISSRRTETGE